MTASTFEVQVVLRPAGERGDRRWVNTEDEAIIAAAEQLGPNQTQVTVVAHVPGDVETFGIRHLTWHDGGPHDSGWRVWRHGKFVGGGELTLLTGDTP